MPFPTHRKDQAHILSDLNKNENGTQLEFLKRMHFPFLKLQMELKHPPSPSAEPYPQPRHSPWPQAPTFSHGCPLLLRRGLKCWNWDKHGGDGAKLASLALGGRPGAFYWIRPLVYLRQKSDNWTGSGSRVANVQVIAGDLPLISRYQRSVQFTWRKMSALDGGLYGFRSWWWPSPPKTPPPLGSTPKSSRYFTAQSWQRG